MPALTAHCQNLPGLDFMSAHSSREARGNARHRLYRGVKLQAEKVFVIGPVLLYCEAGLCCQLGEALEGVFVGILGANAFSLEE